MKIIINVGRQLGSGGRVIAKLLADEFGCQFYDREILNLAAKESGFSEEFFEQNDEHKGFLRSLFHVRLPYVSDNDIHANRFSQESLFQFQSDAIRRAAEAGSCVFVGRCADYVLRDMENVINIFITAPLDYRIRQVRERHGCDEAAARKIITDQEKDRASYYNFYTGKRWGDSASYDLCVDASILGQEKTAKWIAEFIRKSIEGKSAGV
ncbi:MAG: cytidylate kinase-like family protein [Prevotella sp.]|nr:cytidylate kinase-like family protein [Prevotella sp.]